VRQICSKNRELSGYHIVTGEKILQGIIRHLPILTADEKDFLAALSSFPRKIVLEGVLVSWWT
jgi:hypothetical protein